MAKKRIKKKRPGSRRWLAVSTLAAYSFAGSGKFALAQKQIASNPSPASNTQYLDGLPVRRYDLAPGNLDTVVREFQKVAGVAVVFSNPAAAQVFSPGVSGVYTATQALDKLLTNTGVEYRVANDKTIQLSLKSVQTVIEVQANSPQLAASTPKFTEPLLNTPQTIGVVSNQTMEQQGALLCATHYVTWPASASRQVRAVHKGITSPFADSPRATTCLSTACAISAVTIAILLTPRK